MWESSRYKRALDRHVKATICFEQEIDNFWIDLVKKETDLFMTNYLGYWAGVLNETPN